MFILNYNKLDQATESNLMNLRKEKTSKTKGENVHVLKKQDGMSLIGWLIAIILIVVITIPAMKIMPIYIKDIKIHSEMNKLGDDILKQDNVRITPEKIRSHLLDCFAGRGVTDITPDEILISESEDNFNVRVEHEFKARIISDQYFTLHSERTVNIPIIIKH